MSTPRPRYRECHSVKMFWSNAPKWVESEATAVDPAPQTAWARGANVASAGVRTRAWSHLACQRSAPARRPAASSAQPARPDPSIGPRAVILPNTGPGALPRQIGQARTTQGRRRLRLVTAFLPTPHHGAERTTRPGPDYAAGLLSTARTWH